MRRNFLPLVILSSLLTLPSFAQAPVPFIRLPLVPAATAPGGGDFTLTVNGAGFSGNSVVDWNGSPLTTQFVSNTRLTATVPAADIALASTATVTVINPGSVSNAIFFPITLPTSSIAVSRTDIVAGSSPETAAVGDFNGDGKLDLAVSNNAGGTVSVMLGNGDGTFQAHSDYATGPGPSTVLARDFNGDGKLDLAVRNQNSATVAILLGNGDGTFQPAVYYAAGFGASRMVAGDFNGDGKLDLATTNSSEGSVSVLLGKGDGTFHTHVDFATGPSPLPIAMDDVNGDGKLDLVVGDTTGTSYAVLLGNGDGTFQPDTTAPTISDPQSVVLADFNGDGLPDLAVFSESGGNPGLDILLANGNGSFHDLAKYPTGCSSDPADCTAVAADLNGDGILDLAVRNGSTSNISVLLGNGDATFQDPILFRTGTQPEQVVVADFNGDGRLDLVIPDLNGNMVTVLLQSVPGPTAALSPTSVDFGGQLLHTTSAAQTVTLTNTGSDTLEIAGITASGSFAAKNNCGSSLAPGTQCAIRVMFRPHKRAPIAGTLTITDNAADSPQSVPLTGIGTVVTLSPTSLSFGAQAVGTTSSPQTVTLTNNGDHALKISGNGVSGNNRAAFAETNNCGTSVPAGGSCTFSVTFAPAKTGSASATLGVADDGGGSPQTVTLNGSGT